MTYDGERPPADTSSRPQRRIVVPVVIDGPGAPRGRFWRSRLVAVGVAGVVLAAWGLVQLFGNPFGGDGMRGPYGRFPPPVAAQPPQHSLQLVAVITTGQKATVYGGVAIEQPNSGGVKAVNIATGKLFWSYQRRVDRMAVDSATGELFALGDRISMIDIRSGHLRWSRNVPRVTAADYETPDLLVADAGAGMMTIIGDRGIAGLDRASGTTRWTEQWPADCNYNPVVVQATAIAGTVAVTCGPPVKSVVGFDVKTGTRRWDVQSSNLFPNIKLDNDNTLFTRALPVGGSLAVGTTGATALLDPATGTVTARHHWTDGRSPIAFSGSVQVSECQVGLKAEDLCGDDPATGKALWRTHIPKAPDVAAIGDYETLAVADGRVYMVVNRTSEYDYQLVVFDLATGRVLDQLPLPESFRPGSLIRSSRISDGVVDLSTDTHEFLFAERPDLHTLHLN
ncbi:PQQ-binding-like beta-propeller repeat protein [Actinoallomurus sp. CA-150999]|uniref:outer membrane protein assembly factor BamB family protein n=1 Tax=Actinoallomurus sp. CA-150999 TaxID=3239887 RepID=UPI003D91296A